MRLSQLFPNRSFTTDPHVRGLCEDSRLAQPGDIFFAHLGKRADGIGYLNDAIMKGCVAIVVPEGSSLPNILPTLPVVFSTDTRREISRVAAALYPQKPKTILAVTGTSGKTSTTYFVQQIFNLCGVRAVSLGTIGIAGAVTREGSLTTPTAPELHETLAFLHAQGVEVVAMEASSQALAQSRMDHVHLTAAAFLNLSRDHLDYHETLDSYRAAKFRLFQEILPVQGTAIINNNDKTARDLKETVHARGIKCLTYGSTESDFLLTAHQITSNGQQITFTHQEKSYTVMLHVPGRFQVENMLAAFGLSVAAGLGIDQILAVAPQIQAPPGRLQPITGHPQGAKIYVDYAHKPDALENVLRELKNQAPQKLICVFGCGGDRDAGKRPLMGEISARYATHTIVTDDNPRTEDPAAIRAAIRAACPDALDISDRRQAIRTALSMAGTDDIVLIAGKGHEQGQKFATHTDPFDDVIEAEKAIQSLIFSSSPLPLKVLP